MSLAVNQHVIELKEVRIRPKIDDHDLETKGRQAAKFLDAGDKVKLTVLFRGREMAHPDLGKGSCSISLPISSVRMARSNNHRGWKAGR